MATLTLTDRKMRVADLRRNRPKSRFLQWCGIVALGGVVWAWTTAGPLMGRLSAERRWINFKNFASELVPAPVRKSGNWGEAFPWAWGLLTEGGFEALLVTFGIATAAIILSGTIAIPWLPMASRKLADSNPLGIWGGRRSRAVEFLWKVTGPVVRFVFVLARAIPEYLTAFLLLSLLGLQVWPLILALALHNFGILGRLWGEVVENADTEAAEQSIAAGGGRYTTYLSRMFPENFNRFLIYFFYRWETCMKDATVLGMLGLLTLGKLIILSKGFHWDEMFFYVLLGASVILVGDLFSTFLRRRLR